MRLLFFVVGLVLGLVLLGGCGGPVAAHRNEPPGSGGSGGSTTTSTGEGGELFTGSGGAAPACEGDCVQVHSSPFEGPTMMWFGPTIDAPPCPEIAPFAGFEGYADLHVAPPTCPACACSPASCALPEAMHASAAKCADAEGAAAFPFDAPAAWQGACTAEDAIAAGLVCGDMACVQSLTIAAPTIEPCQPTTQGAAQLPPPAWGTTARECLITLSDTCPIEGTSCAPTPPEGFTLCVYREGADPADPLNACPQEYPERHVVHAGAIDSRTCAPCACSQAEGECAALVSTYGDAACGQVVASVMVASAQGACVDLLNGTALAGKSAAWVIDEPGSCTPSGGAPLGEIQPAGAMTYCCQPALVPAE